jgi:glycosyltransferase involved in cell wall biosynthesis
MPSRGDAGFAGIAVRFAGRERKATRGVRIVHLVISGEVAGGQSVALQLARAARARGDTVEFAVPEPGPFVERLRDEGFLGHPIRLRRSFDVLAARRLRRLLDRTTILHTHTLVAGNVLGALASPGPVIRHLHIENSFRRATEPVLRRLDNVTSRRCARLIAVSDDTRRAYERQGYRAGSIDVVYNGIELDGASSAGDVRAELGIPAGVPVVGEIGRLCDVKGQRELIQALTHLPGVHLLLVGKDLERGGAFQSELERDAERLGVRERVVFAGHRDDARALLDELDLFVLPSWTEGLPLVVLEAMAHGRAVVATPVGGTPELVEDGETGVLVPPRDPGTLAEAVGRLLADPELRRRMGEAGRARVAERFAPESMTRRVLAIYDEVAA